MEALSPKGALPAALYAPQRPHDKQEAVSRTELPAPQTVAPADHGEATNGVHRDDLVERSVAADEAEKDIAETDMRREIELDSETADVVFKVVDTETGEIVNQVPSETILKVRAYARDGADARGSGSSDASTAVDETTHVDRQA